MVAPSSSSTRWSPFPQRSTCASMTGARPSTARCSGPRARQSAFASCRLRPIRAPADSAVAEPSSIGRMRLRRAMARGALRLRRRRPRARRPRGDRGVGVGGEVRGAPLHRTRACPCSGSIVPKSETSDFGGRGRERSERVRGCCLTRVRTPSPHAPKSLRSIRCVALSPRERKAPTRLGPGLATLPALARGREGICRAAASRTGGAGGRRPSSAP